MKILFIQVTHAVHCEYEVHEQLALHAGPELVRCTFISQAQETGRAEQSITEELQPLHRFWADFGRDMESLPRPSHGRRGWMVASRIPARLAFLYKLARKERPDFIYSSQQHLDSLYARSLETLTGIPRILHLHYEAGPWLGHMAVHAIRATPYLLVSSSFLQQSMANVGIDPAGVRVVPDVINARNFSGPLEPCYIQRQFGWPEDTPVVISVGRLDPGKRHDITLRAITRVRQEIPNVKLVVCGTIPAGRSHSLYLRKLVEDLNLGEAVEFAGFRHDIPKLMASSDLFCLPTENEAFGLVFPEAMISGLAVVSVKSGAVPEIVVHGETGLLSQPGDVNSLAADMIRLLKDRELARQFGQAGRERALRCYIPASGTPAWVNALNDCYRRAYGQHGKLMEQKVLD